MARRKKKPVKVELIPEFEDGRQVKSYPYQVLDYLIKKYHADLADARIALCWQDGWQPDRDGLVKVGHVKKAADLDRALAAWDIAIQINRPIWEDTEFAREQKEYLLDHQLCHIVLEKHEDGEPKRDVRGRLLYRLRRHDIEEFTAIVGRYDSHVHGQLQEFVRVILERQSAPLFPPPRPMPSAAQVVEAPPPETPPVVEGMPLAELEIPARARKQLEKEGIVTVEELLRRQQDTGLELAPFLKQFPQISAVAAEAIARVIAPYQTGAEQEAG